MAGQQELPTEGGVLQEGWTAPPISQAPRQGRLESGKIALEGPRREKLKERPKLNTPSPKAAEGAGDEPDADSGREGAEPEEGGGKGAKGLPSLSGGSFQLRLPPPTKGRPSSCASSPPPHTQPGEATCCLAGMGWDVNGCPLEGCLPLAKSGQAQPKKGAGGRDSLIRWDEKLLKTPAFCLGGGGEHPR